MKLLEEAAEIKDKPDAKELVVTQGLIEFENVSVSRLSASRVTGLPLICTCDITSVLLRRQSPGAYQCELQNHGRPVGGFLWGACT